MSKYVAAAICLASSTLTCACSAQDSNPLLRPNASAMAQGIAQAAGSQMSNPTGSPVALLLSGGDGFTPAPMTLLTSDFASTPIGTMPDGWKTNASGRILSAPGLPGRWLELQNSATYKLTASTSLPARFTVEFDLVAVAETPRDAGNPSFGFARNNGVADYTSDGYSNGALNGVTLIYGNQASGAVMVGSAATGFNSTPSFDLGDYANRVLHVSISVDGDQERIYLDHTKIVDTRMFGSGSSRYFFISGPVSYQHDAKVLFGNFRIGGYP